MVPRQSLTRQRIAKVHRAVVARAQYCCTVSPDGGPHAKIPGVGRTYGVSSCRWHSKNPGWYAGGSGQPVLSGDACRFVFSRRRILYLS